LQPWLRKPTHLLIAKLCEVEPGDPFGVDEEVELGDLAATQCYGGDRERPPVAEPTIPAAPLMMARRKVRSTRDQSRPWSATFATHARAARAVSTPRPKLGVSVALYLLVAGPVLAVCLYAIARDEPDAVERAVADVERFIDLRERAHTELAATGSFDRFIEIKDEARKRLWRPASGRARHEHRSSKRESGALPRIDLKPSSGLVRALSAKARTGSE
jgi:hypothetical protein